MTPIAFNALGSLSLNTKTLPRQTAIRFGAQHHHGTHTCKGVHTHDTHTHAEQGKKPPEGQYYLQVEKQWTPVRIPLGFQLEWHGKPEKGHGHLKPIDGFKVPDRLSAPPTGKYYAHPITLPPRSPKGIRFLRAPLQFLYELFESFLALFRRTPARFAQAPGVLLDEIAIPPGYEYPWHPGHLHPLEPVQNNLKPTGVHQHA